MARDFTNEEKEVIINCGAFSFPTYKVASLLEIEESKLKQHPDFYKLMKKGEHTADYVLTLKVFEKAKTGDLKALEEFEDRRAATT